MSQELTDNLADTKQMLEELGGEDAAKKAVERSRISNLLKFNILYERMVDLELQSKSEMICRSVAAKVVCEMPGMNAETLHELMKNRDPQL